MYFKDVGYLMIEKQSTARLHRPKISYEEKKIFCNIKSISQTEFYQAATSGFKPEIKVEAKCVDLDGATHFKYNGKLYKILRIYRKVDVVELTLTAMIIDDE